MTKEQQDTLNYWLKSKADAVIMYDDAVNSPHPDKTEISAWEGVIENFDHEIAMIQKEIRNERYKI